MVYFLLVGLLEEVQDSTLRRRGVHGVAGAFCVLPFVAASGVPTYLLDLGNCGS